LILSFIASAGFGILFNAPRRTILAGGLSGAFGWLIFYIATEYGIDSVIASFLGAIVLTAISIASSRKLKAPVIIFITCGIIPLVPGVTAYNAMRSIVLEVYNLALSYGFHVTLISLVFAIGNISTQLFDSLIQTHNRDLKNIMK